MLKVVLAVVLLIGLLLAAAVWYWVGRARTMARASAQRRSARFARMHAKRQHAELDYVQAQLRREADGLRSNGDPTSRHRLTRVKELLGVLESSRALRRETVNLAELCANVAGSFGAAGARRTVRFDPPADPAACAMRGDARALRWVLEELLSNVIAHGGEWSTIELHLEPDGQRIRLGFADDGVGIELTAAARVYAAFTPRVDSAGPGVGLYAVRQIVEAHGGHVRARAGNPRGLVHELEFPSAAAVGRLEDSALAARAG